jgi:hypothetical protein
MVHKRVRKSESTNKQLIKTHWPIVQPYILCSGLSIFTHSKDDMVFSIL